MEKKKRGIRASLSLLASPRFGAFLAFSLLSNMGTWVQLVAEPWLLLNLTGSTFLVGLDAFFMSGPVLFLTFFGGMLADRYDRRGVIFLFQSIQMLCPLLLVLLILHNALSPWIIVSLSLVVGITDALSMPAFQSIVPLIVREDQVSPALALNSAAFSLSRVLGPALGGWLMARYGAVPCFALNAVSYLPFIFAAYWVLPAVTANAGIKEEANLASSLKLIRAPRLRGALLSVALMGIFCGPVFTFSSALVRSVLHGNVGDFGDSMAAFGIGGLLGAGALLWFADLVDPLRAGAVAATLYGALLLTTGLLTTEHRLVVYMMAAGALMAIGSTLANTVVQRNASRGNLGQASGLFMLSMRGGLAAGNFLAGTLIAPIGVVALFTVNGALAMIVQVWNYFGWNRAPSRKRRAASATPSA